MCVCFWPCRMIVSDMRATGTSRSWGNRVMDVRLCVCGAVEHLKAVRAALAGHQLRLLTLLNGESSSQPLLSTTSLPLPTNLPHVLLLSHLLLNVLTFHYYLFHLTPFLKHILPIASTFLNVMLFKSSIDSSHNLPFEIVNYDKRWFLVTK